MALATDTFEGRTTINPASDGGTWTVIDSWDVAGGGARAQGTGLDNQILRELGTVAQDITWQLSMSTGPLDLSSSLLMCWSPDTPGHPGSPKMIKLAYDGSGWFQAGIQDWGGFTPFTGGTFTGVAWGTSSTSIRMRYVPSVALLQIWQGSTLLFDYTLSTVELTGLGTQAGALFRRAYAIAGEMLLNFSAVDSSSSPLLSKFLVSPMPDGRLLSILGSHLGTATGTAKITVSGVDYPLTVTSWSDTGLTVSGGWPSTDSGPVTGNVVATTAAVSGGTTSSPATLSTYFSDMGYSDGPRQAVVGIIVPTAVPDSITLTVYWRTDTANGWTDGMPRLYLTPVGTTMGTAQTQVDTTGTTEIVPDSYAAGTDPLGNPCYVAQYTLSNAQIAPYATAGTDPTVNGMSLRTNFAKTPMTFTTWRTGDWIVMPTVGADNVGNAVGHMASATLNTTAPGTAAADTNPLSLTINPPELQPSGGGGSGGAPGHGGSMGSSAGLIGTGPRYHRVVPPEVAATFSVRKATYTRTAPALVLAGLAVREPLLAGVSKSGATLSAPAPAEGLRPATSVNLGADWRWLPTDATYNDTGSGMTWHTSVGGAKNWAGVTGQLPYLDPAFPLPTAHGETTTGALIFETGTWLQLPVDPKAHFTIALVARFLHSPTASFYDVLASPSGAADRIRAVDLTLRYRGAAMHLWSAGHKYVDDDLTMWSRGSAYGESIKRRPVILVWSQGPYHAHYYRLDALGHRSLTRKLRGSPVGNYDLNLFLGRSGATYDPDGGAHMQVFDLAMWNNVALSNYKMAGVARKLNSIYGVHR